MEPEHVYESHLHISCAMILSHFIVRVVLLRIASGSSIYNLSTFFVRSVVNRLSVL